MGIATFYLLEQHKKRKEKVKQGDKRKAKQRDKKGQTSKKK
ncbi:hypothetical protein [Virgibacillus salexigens]|nr:hypothetical protein [Virgibacillus salexigens]